MARRLFLLIALLQLCPLPALSTLIRPTREPDPDHQTQVLYQNNLLHEHEISEKQNRTLTIQMTAVTGSSVKEQSTPSSLTAQETPLSSSYSLLNKIFPNIFMDPPVTHNKVKGTGTEEDKKKKTLLPDLKQDNNTGNNDGKSVRTTNITLRIHSADSSSQTQIDIYSLKDSREVPEVHIVANSIINQGIKIDSVVLKDNGLEVIVNSSVDKRVKYIPAKGKRKSLIKCDHGITGENTQEGSVKNSPITVFETLKDSQMKTTTNQFQFSEESEPEVLSTQEYSSQSTSQEPETSVNEIENILETLKEENGKPGKKMDSLLENILQELKKISEQSDSTEEDFTMTTESSTEESYTKEFSVEPQFSQPPKPTSLPNLRMDEGNEDIKDAKRFEFFEKYEGIQDKKRAKATDFKDLVKDIVITCVAVLGLILATIVLVHIYTSLFVKKQQDSGVSNATIYKEDTRTANAPSQSLLPSSVTSRGGNQARKTPVMQMLSPQASSQPSCLWRGQPGWEDAGEGSNRSPSPFLTQLPPEGAARPRRRQKSKRFLPKSPLSTAASSRGSVLGHGPGGGGLQIQALAPAPSS